MSPDHGHPFDSPVPRRTAIVMLAGTALLAACSRDSSAGSTSSSTATPDTTTPGTITPDTTTAPASTVAAPGDSSDIAFLCSTPIPEETAGPFPGDGSNGPDVLGDPASVRDDLTGSFGTYSGTAAGVPVTLHLTVLDSGRGCAALTGGAIYVWHADRDGLYSMYTAAAANYLRGVGELDDTGTATFRTIFPGCYDGRWPHIHFEVYRSLADAASATGQVITSQLALPQDMCEVAYAATGYERSAENLAHTTLDTDMVFRDGVDEQMAIVTGNAADGFTIELTMAV